MWLKTVCRKCDLNLKLVLVGGQCFRWRENDPGVFTGVIEGLVWQIRWSPDVNDQLEFKVHGNKSFKPDAEALRKKLVDYLRLDTPLESLYKQWAKSDKHFEKVVENEKFLGVRMLNQQPRENLFSFICSSNNHISRISGMVENLCVFYGDKICNLDGKDYFAFPSIERLAKPDVEGKLRESKFGYRASFIQKSAEKIVANGGEEWLHSLTKMDYNEAKQSLVTLPGIGAKVADCICLMSLGHLQAVPVDTHVFQIATNWYLPHLKKNKTVTTRVYDEVSGHFQSLYGPLAGWAHTVLFCADLKMFQEDKPKVQKSTRPAPTIETEVKPKRKRRAK